MWWSCCGDILLEVGFGDGAVVVSNDCEKCVQC
jgi:hypothetical protein